MIDRCDPSIATWSSSGDSFVVKSVEKFATSVLPMYFKHSNFSSFARQLNFYGFRKLKAEPILTADFDARTACYVRFYHEKFQKDKPELLSQIKRATKSDQQSKDDVEDLKVEICRLRECMNSLSDEYDRRFTEMSYEYNRRITSLSAEYDKLTMLMHQMLTFQSESSQKPPAVASSSTTRSGVTDLMQSLSQVAAMTLQNSLRSTNVATGAPSACHGFSCHTTKRSPDPDDDDCSSSRPRLN
jgi:predicted site-specific integrase-resolvase